MTGFVLGTGVEGEAAGGREAGGGGIRGVGIADEDAVIIDGD